MSEATAEVPTEGQQAPQIVNEEAFCRTLGLNPDIVMAGSITVEFTAQGTVVGWASKVIVPPQQVGLALMAGSGMHIVEEAAPEPKKPADRRPAKKAAAKKAPAKKAAAKR